jgi:hypothetical protein
LEENTHTLFICVLLPCGSQDSCSTFNRFDFTFATGKNEREVEHGLDGFCMSDLKGNREKVG